MWVKRRSAHTELLTFISNDYISIRCQNYWHMSRKWSKLIVNKHDTQFFPLIECSLKNKFVNIITVFLHPLIYPPWGKDKHENNLPGKGQVTDNKKLKRSGNVHSVFSVYKVPTLHMIPICKVNDSSEPVLLHCICHCSSKTALRISPCISHSSRVLLKLVSTLFKLWFFHISPSSFCCSSCFVCHSITYCLYVFVLYAQFMCMVLLFTVFVCFCCTTSHKLFAFASASISIS